MASITHSAPQECALQFRIGGLKCWSLSDGYIPSPVKNSAPVVPEAELAAFLSERGEHLTERNTPLNCLLIELPKVGYTVVDAGIGSMPGVGGKPVATAGRFRESLAASGVSPSEINVVLVSHLHPDHIGGLFGDDDQPLFANATYFVPEEDVEFWGGSTPDLSGSLLPPPMRVDVVKAAHRFLRLAAGKLSTFRAGEDPVPGVRSMLLAGHTPGQVGFLFESEGEALLYSADAISHPFISIERPEWRHGFDADSNRAIATRKVLIVQLLENSWYNFTPHFPWPAFGRLRAKEDAVFWHPGR